MAIKQPEAQRPTCSPQDHRWGKTTPVGGQRYQSCDKCGDVRLVDHDVGQQGGIRTQNGANYRSDPKRSKLTKRSHK